MNARDESLRVTPEALRHFCQGVFQALDVPRRDAAIAADVLVSADLRGINSHGVARLQRYVDGLQSGTMAARPDVQVVRETPTTALVDAGAGLGHPVAYRAMDRAIQKALDVGVGFVSVRNSNHYGIAGYYAMMALEHDCIGISMTNAGVLVAPTFGRDAVLGTNPIAVAAPAAEERALVLDMATSIVSRGKLEVYRRQGKPIPSGWALDETGTPTTDTERVLANFEDKKQGGGGLLPLGGAGELLGGHKGYGLSLMVDILSGVLSGAAYANLVYPRDAAGHLLPSNIGHLFGAWRIDAFRPAGEFKATLDDLQRRLKEVPKAKGQDRIYVHGEKEYEAATRHSRVGIPLSPTVAADLRALASTFNVSLTEI
ncbi:MAG: Ldh family oxidoreductase [Anaerolineae bacterium]|jgi:LDH2 family malate/lactate/ureidoglycolate dehydrogenase